jgi:hypothetical protein
MKLLKQLKFLTGIMITISPGKKFDLNFKRFNRDKSKNLINYHKDQGW